MYTQGHTANRCCDCFRVSPARAGPDRTGKTGVRTCRCWGVGRSAVPLVSRLVSSGRHRDHGNERTFSTRSKVAELLAGSGRGAAAISRPPSYPGATVIQAISSDRRMTVLFDEALDPFPMVAAAIFSTSYWATEEEIRRGATGSSHSSCSCSGLACAAVRGWRCTGGMLT